MWPFEAKQDLAAVKAGRELALAEMIKTGTTTFLEMYHLFMNELAEDIERVGVRATLMRSMIGLCPREEQDEKLAEATNFAKSWHQRANGRIQTMMAPHAPYTCPPDFIERIVAVASELDIPVHMHLAETRAEVQEHVKKFGRHPLVHLEELDVLEDIPWLLAHAVHINQAEIELLSRYSIAVSHNPNSNLKLGSGIAPIQQMVEAGVLVALGTDSVAANNSLDLFEEMRTAVFLQKGIAENPAILPAGTALQMATLKGAEALQFHNVGKIEKGWQADFIMIEPRAPHLQPRQHIQSHLVYAAKGSDVTDVYVQGRPLLENGELLTLDEEKKYWLKRTTNMGGLIKSCTEPVQDTVRCERENYLV